MWLGLEGQQESRVGVGGCIEEGSEGGKLGLGTNRVGLMVDAKIKKSGWLCAGFCELWWFSWFCVSQCIEVYICNNSLDMDQRMVHGCGTNWYQVL